MRPRAIARKEFVFDPLVQGVGKSISSPVINAHLRFAPAGDFIKCDHATLIERVLADMVRLYPRNARALGQSKTRAHSK
jgi:hypothetical protein